LLLANAIVEQAANYYIFLITGVGRTRPVPPPDCTIESLEIFFHSQWFELLCMVESDYFLEKMKERIQKMTLQYTVSKERGSSRYYAHRTGEPHLPVPGSFGSKKKALHTAADLQGVLYREYMQIRRKAGANLD